MNIVMPMAGRGSRFAEAGYRDPKPLIDVRGRPMYAWAMESLPLRLARRVIFICLKEHLESLALERDILTRYRKYRPEIIALDGVTEGQACTVLMAQPLIDNDEQLVIFNADTFVVSAVEKRLPRLVEEGADGVLAAFEAAGDQWSFARVNDRGRVVETAEKRRISPLATTGLYHFTRGSDFVKHTKAMIDAEDRTRGEYYVAPVYNRLIAEGADIRVDRAEAVWVLGTPRDLAHFESNYPGGG